MSEQATGGAVGATIYVVQGTCGEYSDRREWLVRAFHIEQDARDFAERCKRSGMEVYAKIEAVGRYSAAADTIKHTSIDPDYEDDYTGPPDYTVIPCPLGPVAQATAPSKENSTAAVPSGQGRLQAS